MTDTRNQLRSGIFKGATLKRQSVQLNNITMEVVQPTVGQVLSLSDTKDQQQRIAKSLIMYCRVPGTDEPVFEDTDFEALMAMPYTSEHIKIQEALGKLMMGDSVPDAIKNSEATA